MAFETEKAHYQRLLPELLQTDEGRFAVFKGEDFLGVFDSDDAAYTAALERYGITSFLLQPIRVKEPIYYLPNISPVSVREDV